MASLSTRDSGWLYRLRIFHGPQIERRIGYPNWPDNYALGNTAKVKGASDGLYDFGDEMFAPVDGYGSMQIHDHATGQTLFSINHWSQGSGADIGIGNSTGQTRDWTFTGNAATYSSKRLRVYVHPH